MNSEKYYTPVHSEAHFDEVVEALVREGYKSPRYTYRILRKRYDAEQIPCVVWYGRKDRIDIEYCHKSWLDEEGYIEQNLVSLVPEELFVL
jgi:hypothetical protein